MKIKLVSSKRGSLGDIDCEPGERLLYAALRAKIPLSHECASGTCGTCKAKLISGRVNSLWDDAPGWRTLKKDSGEILLCQCTPQTDCELGVRLLADTEVASIGPVHTEGEIRRSGMLTRDVLIVELVLLEPMEFHAGQYVLLATGPVDGYRAYSMANWPGCTNTLELIIKRKPDGRMSDLLFDRDIIGQRFKVFGPLGRATFDPSTNASADIVCAAGGTGIAGLMSVLARAANSGWLDSHRASVHFGVRTGADLFFLDRFAALQRSYPDNITVRISTSDEDPPTWAADAYPGLEFCRGMVHESLAAMPMAKFTQPIIYTAGPPGAVSALTKVLIATHHISPARIRFDRFG